MRIISRAPTHTKKVAALLAGEVKKHKTKNALVIGLIGELGAGKTTFIQGFARGLGIKRRLTSPTFLIIRRYKLPFTNYQSLFHVDAYRLKKPKELSALGFKEIITDPKNIVLIEWADKVKKTLPKKTLWIDFRHSRRKNERKITFSIK